MAGRHLATNRFRTAWTQRRRDEDARGQSYRLGAVTADALTLKRPIGSFSLTSIVTQPHIEKARAFTDVYPSRPRGMQASGPRGGSLPGYCSRFPRAP